MADRDFVVKNGLVTGSNNATFGTAVTLASNGNVGIGNTIPSDKLSVTGNITATANITATNLSGTVQTATQGTINHNSLSNYVADQHVAHSNVSISAGNGLTGGGTIAANRTLSVLAGTGIASNTSGVHVTNVPNPVTFNDSGSGVASGNTFNGNSSVTVSYNTVGAPSITGNNASGTWSISVTGNAGTATTLQTARNINGTAFNGSGNITTASWGTARTISIGITGKSVDGSGNISWSLTEIGAPSTTGTGASGTWDINISNNAATATILQTARNINGTSFNGSASITTASWGTARTITIGSTGKSVDGSGNVSWSLTEIGAPSTTGTGASGTWGINISGNAATATTAGTSSTFTSTSQNSQFNSIGIGTGASGTAGEIRATNNITAYYSDRRLKENIKKIENPLEKILKINGVTYNSNDLAAYFGYNDRSVQVGVIAQEIQQVLPMAVKHAPFDIATKHGVEYSKSGENYLTVQYEKIIPLLIEAIKELSSEVELLKNKLGDE